jgi:glycosyltransferase involved in cell wall biosynthesis
MKQVTFVIASYKDDARLKDTLKTLYASCDPALFEIIIVMDGDGDRSYWKETREEIKVLWHKERKGVGAAFDTGVAAATTEQVFLMGSDIRFPEWDKEWMPRFLENVKANPYAIICTKCGKLNKDNLWPIRGRVFCFGTLSRSWTFGQCWKLSGLRLKAMACN